MTAVGLSVLAAETVRPWFFDKDTVGGPPAGFAATRSGQGAEGRWVVEAPDAPSKGQVVKQASADATDYRFPVLVASEPMVVDATLSVRFKPVSGKVDQAGRSASPVPSVEPARRGQSALRRDHAYLRSWAGI